MNNRKSNSLLRLLVGSLFAVMFAASQAETLGAAMCERNTAGGPCYSAWDFTNNPREFYWIERFVYESGTEEWISIAGPYTGNKGKSDESMESGFLYRAVGCSDKNKSVECVGSTVYWAPVRPKSVDEIPDVVPTPEGDHHRFKHLDALEQEIYYNLALLRKLTLSVDMLSMPPMTDLPFTDLLKVPDDIWIEDATIDYNVYIGYSN